MRRAVESCRAQQGNAIAPDYPNVIDGARGVRFIERTLVSAASDAKWTSFDRTTD